MCSSLRLSALIHQAMVDQDTISRDGVGYVGFLSGGVKIVLLQDSGVIQILNTHAGDICYREISQEDYEYFIEHGWRLGVLKIAIANVLCKLANAERLIELTRKCKKNEKLLTDFTTEKQNLTERYECLINKQRKYHKLKTEGNDREKQSV